MVSRRRSAARSGAAIAVVMVVLAAALQAFFGFRKETAHAFDSLTRSASIIEHELDNSFRVIDSMLIEVTDRVSVGRWPSPDQVSWLSGRLGSLPSIDSALVIDSEGNSVGPAVTAEGPVEQRLDVRHREYFQYFLAHPDDRGLHVGTPFVSRLGNRFSLPVSRPFYDRKSRPAGLVRVTLDPAILMGDIIALAGGSSIAGAVFHAGLPVVDGGFRGPEFARQAQGPALPAASAPSDAGTLSIEGTADAPPRLVAYRRLPRENLIVLVGMRHAEAYAEWRRETARNGILALILSAAILAAGLSFEWRDRLRQALEDRHQAELAAHQQDLERQVAERTAELQRENGIRARTEQALRASRERLRGITDSLFHAILVFNHAGHTVFANIAARRMLGIEGQEVEGLPVDDLLQVVVDGQALFFERSPLREALRGGGLPVHGTEAVIRIVGTGGDLDVSYVCTPLGEEGRRQAVMSFRDITDIKKAQWELLQASRLASVGQLAAGIAHEINTPIQYIGNNLSFIGESLGQLLAVVRENSESGVLRDERTAFLAEELPVAVAESLEGVQHITRIVLSMKEFSHPGSASKSLTDINRALETTLTVSTNVWKHVAAIERRFDPDLPMVPCHAGEMNQVFLNLIVNAVHAIEASGKPLPGRITLTTSRHADHIEIAVEDSGTGIPAAIREKIFDPFFTTKEVGKGTGQGLAICRDVIVAKHGGTLGVGGMEGEGAIFVIDLPLDDSKGTN